MNPRHLVFRPTSSIMLAVMVLVFCAILVVGTVLQGNVEFVLRSFGLIALVGALAVAAFWLPKLEVTEDEIIAFRTERGKITAWASPPASQSVGVSFMIRGMAAPATARPAGPAAGKVNVAQLIQTNWDQRTDVPDLDRGDARPHRTLNIATIAVLGVLAAAALAGLLV